MDSDTLDRIRSNDHRTLSRVISQIENDGDIPDSFFKDVHTIENQALRIGITGPPGAGKSTLTNLLIQQYIDDGKSVGVVAVDPTSPFTGGALLGDRVRMNNYIWDDNVFIRSMGSHGDLGGLARKTQDVGDILSASGKDVVIIETVGVGQGEHDVAKAVDLTLVLLVPESGDEIQLMKAGLIEIGDMFVINKSDREGAGRLAQTLKSMLHTFTKKGKLEPPVYNTSADRNEGIADLYNALNELLSVMESKGILIQKQLDRHRNRVYNLIQDRLLKKFWTPERLDQLEISINNLETTQTSPHEVASILLNKAHE
ncbi:MAG: methylmalonyl Co-A mutase-associated GTPase MeaB [Candidatus Marinimicrobia bacterium]|nr:methylmalonyl Co-A mutase-associated GTPase MeaB [Candidatus Neomarinimicrobiota bacterium]MBL7009739.1 methylmalonyl Co-A mutase-associated GTPase MeaB [Candidatus Neomarinimicrobiota bacterium]MBL7029857.1 methylmalonyl Co-A mutase-associated GTPase MeaB [Candidatus Neomarinimicrobiota bacterium]